MASKFSITKMKGEPKVSEETALKLILKTCLKFDIDVDSELDKKKRKNTEAMLSSIQDFIMRGIIDIDTKTWEIKHVLQGNYSETLKEIVYKPITGKQKRAMDGKGEEDQFEKMYAVLGESSGLGEDIIEKLIGIDLKVAESMTLFFL